MRPKPKHTSPADPEPDDGLNANRSGIVGPERQEGQRRAQRRAARYQGFTKTVPSVDVAVCELTSALANTRLGRAACATLAVLLHALPRRRWANLPVVRITNGDLAAMTGRHERSVQQHLARLQKEGVIAIEYGRGNTRLCFDLSRGQPGAAEPGIDLRPAIVYAEELALLRRQLVEAKQSFMTEQKQVLEAVMAARFALGSCGHIAAERYLAADSEINAIREGIKQLRRTVITSTATLAAIAADRESLQAFGRQARDLAEQLRREDDAADDSGENSSGSSSQAGEGLDQLTESNFVESVVPTIQASLDRAGLRPARATGEEEPAEVGEIGPASEPALPVLYARWLGAYDGNRPLPSAELVELEITARLQARHYGIARRVLEQATARHGLALVIGAVLFVTGLPETARIRNRGALLASLLQRPEGALTPASFTRRRPEATPLGEAEALAIAKRLAPGHQPTWVLGRWRTTRQRREEPITDPRACLAGFARKLQREHGGFARAD